MKPAIIFSKIANFQVRSFENITRLIKKLTKRDIQDNSMVTLVFQAIFKLLVLPNGKLKVSKLRRHFLNSSSKVKITIIIYYIIPQIQIVQSKYRIATT